MTENNDKTHEALLPKPPRAKPEFTTPGTSDLLSRLNAFIPTIAAANEKLDDPSLKIEVDGDSDSDDYIDSEYDDRDEDPEASAKGGAGVETMGKKPKGAIIELNLGLGVLEHVRPNNNGSGTTAIKGDGGSEGGEEDNILAAIFKNRKAGQEEQNIELPGGARVDTKTAAAQDDEKDEPPKNKQKQLIEEVE